MVRAIDGGKEGCIRRKATPRKEGTQDRKKGVEVVVEGDNSSMVRVPIGPNPMLTRGYPAGALVRRGGDYEGVFEPYGDERVPPKRLSRPLVMMRMSVEMYSGCFFVFFCFYSFFCSRRQEGQRILKGGGGGLAKKGRPVTIGPPGWSSRERRGGGCVNGIRGKRWGKARIYQEGGASRRKGDARKREGIR